ncbi:MAG: IS91 family transposase [Planctomycetes bacterium]|nr:IS91 family transposase [Planctomycetota bacterium]MCB9878918.1 IS91 family transposase [Planctomycetota bacterium]
MARATFEVADVIDRFSEQLLAEAPVSLDQKRVMHALTACRTAQLGGHVEACDHCDYRRIAYNSCRNRHCPKCQGTRQAKWLDDRAKDLLPVEYFHVVFTVPEEIAAIVLQNKRVLYGILFRASSETLQTIAADERHLGAEIGFVSVLHTWSQDLRHHPHVHCVVPGGGLSADGSWVACRPGFFLPVRVLSKMYRGRFVALLRAAFECGELGFHGKLAALRDPDCFAQCLDRAMATPWVVYSKAPFGGPEQVLKYLARYTHRVAIGNSRILGIDDASVTFRVRDRAQDGRHRTMTLPGVEFLRRFLLHVLPKGLQRIRHYGLLANRRRAINLALARLQVGAAMPISAVVGVTPFEPFDVSCPACGKGQLHRGPFTDVTMTLLLDSS